MTFEPPDFISEFEREAYRAGHSDGRSGIAPDLGDWEGLYAFAYGVGYGQGHLVRLREGEPL